MFPTTLGALRSRHPDTEVLVASMGAIQKPNGDIRPIHDATHHVQLNNRIVFQDQLQYPGPEDAAGVIREVTETKEAMFSISADIRSAHRLVKIRQKDHPLICCKASSSSEDLGEHRGDLRGIKCLLLVDETDGCPGKTGQQCHGTGEKLPAHLCR